MTNVNAIIDMLVKGGFNEAQAFEYAEAQDVQAERAYIDFCAEEIRDAEEIAYWAEVEREEREYYERNYKPFMEWTEANISGKSIEEIAPEVWDCYSDWHKDLYGFRPHYVPVKVEREENHVVFYSHTRWDEDI